MGFDLAGKTVGVVGTGRIGALVARIFTGMGCRVVATDPYPDAALAATGTEYVELDALLARSHVISLHCPLTAGTQHLIGAGALARMRRGVLLVNTGRGALVDTRALIAALKSGHVGYVALDVYEEEAALFFEDRSERGIPDDVFARLITFPNVLITGHQGFFTTEALAAIAETTLAAVTDFEQGRPPAHAVRLQPSRP
jgi:D-lactate dehydrogenase